MAQPDVSHALTNLTPIEQDRDKPRTCTTDPVHRALPFRMETPAYENSIGHGGVTTTLHGMRLVVAATLRGAPLSSDTFSFAAGDSPLDAYFVWSPVRASTFNNVYPFFSCQEKSVAPFVALKATQLTLLLDEPSRECKLCESRLHCVWFALSTNKHTRRHFIPMHDGFMHVGYHCLPCKSSGTM